MSGGRCVENPHPAVNNVSDEEKLPLRAIFEEEMPWRQRIVLQAKAVHPRADASGHSSVEKTLEYTSGYASIPSVGREVRIGLEKDKNGDP